MVRLEGASNFRDIGPIVAGDGRRLRAGVIYRSNGLFELTKNDLEILDRLRLRVICDLRSDRERLRSPTAFPAGRVIRLAHLPIDADARANSLSFWASLAAQPDETGVRQAMLSVYHDFPAAFAPVLSRLFDFLIEPDTTPIVVHCHAGKDRTGFASAMILWALGMPLETIMADYLLTNERIEVISDSALTESTISKLIERRLGVRLNAAALRTFSYASADYLMAAIESARDEFGSIDLYLERVGSLNPAKREQMRSLLLE